MEQFCVLSSFSFLIILVSPFVEVKGSDSLILRSSKIGLFPSSVNFEHNKMAELNLKDVLNALKNRTDFYCFEYSKNNHFLCLNNLKSTFSKFSLKDKNVKNINI